MFVIQKGEVEALAELDGNELKLRKMGPNEFFGEMALFEEEVRTATVRATKKTRVLTIDKKNFLGGQKSQLTQHLFLEEEQHVQDLPEHGLGAGRQDAGRAVRV